MSVAQAAELLQQGISAAKGGRKEDARYLLLQVVDLDEHNEQAWLWLSGLVDSIDEKRICLENVLSINPNNAHAQAGLRWLAQHAPDPAVESQDTPAPEDLQVYEAAQSPREPQPTEPPVLQDLCFRCEAPVPASETECPSCGQALIVACPSCGRYVEIEQTACPSCGQPLGDVSQGAAYYVALAQSYLERRRTDRALEALAWADAEPSTDPDILARSAAMYEKLGRPDSAIAAYERAVSLSPDRADICARLGVLYHQKGKNDTARSMYEQAARIKGPDAMILTELARLQIEESGPTRESIGKLTHAVKVDPKYAPAYLLLGDVYAGQQEIGQAYRQYQLACDVTEPGSSIGLEARRRLTELQHAVASPSSAVDAQPTDLRRSSPHTRPGCLSVYAVLLAFSGVTGVLGAILGGLGLALGGETLQQVGSLQSKIGLPPGFPSLTATLMGAIGLGLAFSVLYLVIAVGLWSLKNWARIVTIILETLRLLGSIASAVVAIGAARLVSDAYGQMTFPIVLMVGLLLSLLIQGYILFWFVANGDRFN